MNKIKKEVRNISIHIRVSKEEKEAIEDRARKDNRSLSDHIRLAALGK
jgi:Ribbon-helix-helix protein, copG family.